MKMPSARLQVALGAAEGVVQAVRLDRVGPRDQEEVGVITGGDGRAHLHLHDLDGLDLLARQVAATLRRALVLDEDRRDAHRLIFADGAGYVLGVAIGVVGIDQHGQRAGGDDVAHAGPLLAELHQVDIGEPVPRTRQREPADLVGPEPGPHDEPCRQGVVRRQAGATDSWC